MRVTWLRFILTLLLHFQIFLWSRCIPAYRHPPQCHHRVVQKPAWRWTAPGKKKLWFKKTKQWSNRTLPHHLPHMQSLPRLRQLRPEPCFRPLLKQCLKSFLRSSGGTWRRECGGRKKKDQRITETVEIFSRRWKLQYSRLCVVVEWSVCLLVAARPGKWKSETKRASDYEVCYTIESGWRWLASCWGWAVAATKWMALWWALQQVNSTSLYCRREKKTMLLEAAARVETLRIVKTLF